MEDIEIDDVHPKTFIHIDVDCFYAQVEEILNPELRTKPLGIQQKNIVVTCNYVARNYGVKKLMLISESRKLCPDLVLVNGEDLTRYRDMSSRIFDVIRTFTPYVEKLGFDENFIDVTTIVSEKLSEYELSCSSSDDKKKMLQIDGHIIPDEKSLALCGCGCDKRLILGSILAKEIRDKIYEDLRITCCAGIAHNKILAKLVGSANKPNNQTTLVPCCAAVFMAERGSVRNVAGIGEKTEQLLKEIGIDTIQNLQDCELQRLQKKFGYEIACRLKEISLGIDNSSIRPTGKPKSIGLEDSCKTISVKEDVEEKFRILLVRLVKLINEDGRIPITIKIVLRKFDSKKKTSHRETKQCNILPSLFRVVANDGCKLVLADGGQDKLLKIIMKLFEKAIDMNKPFNITLLGLAFTKFQEKKTGSSSIANFLIKKSDIEVQSVTNLSNESSFDDFNNSTVSFTCSSSSGNTPKIVAMDYERETHSDNSITSSECGGLSTDDVEPSPKKSRIGLFIAKRRCFASHHDPMDIASPSKLRVADLRLNSRDSDRETVVPHHLINTSGNGNDDKSLVLTNVVATGGGDIELKLPGGGGNHNLNNNNNTVPCPSGVDPTVFKELPIEVQTELLASWRTTSPSNTSTPKSQKPSGNNTLHRYFIKNK